MDPTPTSDPRLERLEQLRAECLQLSEYLQGTPGDQPKRNKFSITRSSYRNLAKKLGVTPDEIPGIPPLPEKLAPQPVAAPYVPPTSEDLRGAMSPELAAAFGIPPPSSDDTLRKEIADLKADLKALTFTLHEAQADRDVARGGIVDLGAELAALRDRCNGQAGIIDSQAAVIRALPDNSNLALAQDMLAAALNQSTDLAGQFQDALRMPGASWPALVDRAGRLAQGPTTRTIRRDFWLLMAQIEDMAAEERFDIRRDLQVIQAAAEQALELVDEGAIPKAG
jgi:hypothetical protein